MPSRTLGRTAGALAIVLQLASSAAVAERSLSAAAPARRVETIERVVAVVDERPLLLSDVRTLGRVRGLEAGAAREAAIDERLMYTDASRLAQLEVTPAEEEAAVRALVASQPALAHEVGHPELLRLVHRQLAILKYVEFRFRPQLRVSDEDVRRAWEAEEVGQPSGLPLEDAQETIRARLERQALDERVEAWVRELRARASVRLVDPPPPASVR
jgi:hypothetical protein